MASFPPTAGDIGTLPEQEDRKLISADKVQGTAVYNQDDEKLGSIDSIYIDKYSGEVAYVVMSFGGFLGIGEKYHPLPWDLLDYDTGIGGYRVDLDRDDLIDAPSYDRTALNDYDFDKDTGGVENYYTDRFRSTASNPAISDAEIEDDLSGTPVVPRGGVGAINR